MRGSVLERRDVRLLARLDLRVTLRPAFCVRAFVGIELDRDVELGRRIETPHHVDHIAAILRAQLETELAPQIATRKRTRVVGLATVRERQLGRVTTGTT